MVGNNYTNKRKLKGISFKEFKKEMNKEKLFGNISTLRELKKFLSLEEIINKLDNITSNLLDQYIDYGRRSTKLPFRGNLNSKVSCNRIQNSRSEHYMELVISSGYSKSSTIRVLINPEDLLLAMTGIPVTARTEFRNLENFLSVSDKHEISIEVPKEMAENPEKFATEIEDLLEPYTKLGYVIDKTNLMNTSSRSKFFSSSEVPIVFKATKFYPIPEENL